MTRSKGISRRTAFNKNVRQKAHQQGVLFRTALEQTKAPSNIKVLYRSNPERWDSGRMGVQWNSGAFLCGPQVDDGELFAREEDVYDFQIDFMDTHDLSHHGDMTVSLLDIARPAKQKGVAKDFEVVQKVRNVIALEDDSEGLVQWEDDEWEQIYDERDAEEQRSYSSVLKGNDP